MLLIHGALSALNAATRTANAEKPVSRLQTRALERHLARPVTGVSFEVSHPVGNRCHHSCVDDREESMYAR
jgi:hypothetical protein